MMPQPIFFLVSHSAMGGVQEVWADLAEGFADKGYKVQLLALYPHENSVPRPNGALQWTFVVDRKPTTYLGKIKLLFALARKIGRARPSRIFTAMPGANTLTPIAALIARTGTSVTLSHHTPVETHKRMLNALDGLTGSLSNVVAIVAVSHAVAASLVGKPAGYRAKCTVIPNALPPRIENTLAALSSQRAADRTVGRTVVAIGRLAEQKNYAVLIRAAALMPDVAIRIIGAGPLEVELKALAASAGVSGRVHFLGERSRIEALGLLAAGDIFTQPSLFEGHSLALIEAAKLKLPLVVSDVPVQVEGITAADGMQCGIAVPTTDEKALAAAIIRLLDDPVLYLEASEKAGRLAAEITFGRMVERYLAIPT